MKEFKEIKPRKKPFKEAYIAIMLYFVGRAVQAAAAVDEVVKKEFENLPERFVFSMGVMPCGPYMIVGKDKKGFVRFMGWNPEGKKIDLHLKIKSLEAAMLLFTFQESTCVATARNRLVVDGEVPHACSVVRILDMVEVYLLPKFIAKLAVKRYPTWSPGRKYLGRIVIYIRTILGF